MQTLSSSVAVELPGRSVARAPRRRSRAYLALSLLMTAIVVVGFWPSYFGPMLRGNIARPWIVQLHGAVFVGWMVLLLAQAGLVAQGRTRAHRALGRFGIWYGFLVLAMGLVVSFAAPLIHVAAGEWDLEQAAQFLITPLGDMVLFGAFFGMAIAYRAKPELHKRFIVLATVALLFAAVGRMSSFIPVPPLVLLWISPVLAAIGHQAMTRRRLDPVYAGGLVVLLIGFSRLALQQWEPWLVVARAMLRFAGAP